MALILLTGSFHVIYYIKLPCDTYQYKKRCYLNKLNCDVIIAQIYRFHYILREIHTIPKCAAQDNIYTRDRVMFLPTETNGSD